MAKEYIERGKTINEFATRSSFYDAEWGNKRFTLDDVEEILQSIPAADVRPVVRGRWEWNIDTGYYYCSNCNAVSPREDQEGEYCDTPAFCHVCGADMRGVQDG